MGRPPGRDRDRHRAAGAGRGRSPRQRDPRSLPGLRRHPPSVGPPPVLTGGARRPGGRRGHGRRRGRPPGRRRCRHRGGGTARHGRLRRRARQLGVLRARPARHVHLRSGRSGGGGRHGRRPRRGGGRARRRGRGVHGLRAPPGPPHRRGGQAGPRRLGRSRGGRGRRSRTARPDRASDRDRGPVRVPARLLRGAGRRRRGRRPARRALGAARDLLQALPVQPLHPCRDRRGAGDPLPRCAARGRRGDRARRPHRGAAHDRRAGGGEGPPALGLPRRLQRALHGGGGADRRRRSGRVPRGLHRRGGRRPGAAGAGGARALRAGCQVRRDLPAPVPRGAAGVDHRRHAARGPGRRQPRRPGQSAVLRGAGGEVPAQRAARARRPDRARGRRGRAGAPRGTGRAHSDGRRPGMRPAGRDRAPERLERLVEWSLGPGVLRRADIAHLVTVVTDTVAAILGASAEPEVREAGLSAPRLGGSGPATVLATGVGTSPSAAALANGLAAVRLELDEGHAHAANHPGAHTLPAVLAVAEELDASGSELLEAAATAYEVAVRVARGVRLRRVVHPFGTAMVCGAAVGVARLRGCDVATTTQALLIAAALTPASTQRAANTGATVRNALTGVSASNGVLAVELARGGTTGDPRALETVYGEVLGESFDDEQLDSELGVLRYLSSGYLKLHACSRWNHAPIEATEALVAAHGIRAEDVDAVEVATYYPATRLDGRDAPTGFAGKHSIPYSVAARIVRRDNGIDAYTDEAAADPVLRGLMARVTVIEDPVMTAAVPEVRGARVTVRTGDGRTLIASEDHPPGGADRPYPAADIAAKHRSLLGRALPADAVEAVLRWSAALPEAGSVRGLGVAVGSRR